MIGIETAIGIHGLYMSYIKNFQQTKFAKSPYENIRKIHEAQAVLVQVSAPRKGEMLYRVTTGRQILQDTG